MTKQQRSVCVAILALIALGMVAGVAHAAIGLPPEAAPLIRHFYKVHNTCANVEPFVRHQVKLVYDNDRTVAPKLIKLLYADCMINGCDASILLDGPNTEKESPKTRGLGAFVLIDKIKQVLEARCPGAVSCADILNLATRDAVFFSGGPSYPVFLGRRDGRDSNAAWVDLPSPSISWESSLAYFESKGLDVQDMVTLLGAHTMGRVRCSNILDRLYNFNNTGKSDPSMESLTLRYLRKQCPPKLKLGQPNPLINLNPSNPTHRFINSYYTRVLTNKSVLGVDQQLRYGGDTYDLTDEFASSIEDFKGGFAYSMSRMGGLKVLTGTKGEIRLNCRMVNK
ncbi:peroxidase superfamily protein [Artemisia annua]|uniref:Peroxidase n=1 Tax=Artemisia annua TaxID=35608 RepID=A0A2U1MNC6_ARTAN|nr:peroxidase superfamily protein [Artemisia annua]